VNQMTKQNRSRRRKPYNHIMRRDDLNTMLDILLAFDRSVVEFSMHLYNVPRRDRVALREQNRRVHLALRERLPRLMGPSQSLF
jgi:hypothetical protein